nr:hypothetical protein Iba_chr04aCG22330 [Ipomoea batatas]
MKDAGDYVIGSGSSSYNICSSSEAFVDFSHYAQTEQHFDSSTSSSEEEAEPTSDGEDQRIPQNVSLQRGKAHIPDADIPYYHTGRAMPLKAFELEGIWKEKRARRQANRMSGSSSEAFVDFSHYAQTEQHFDSSTSSSEEEAEPTSDGEDQRIPQNVSLQRGKAHIPDADIPYYHTGR